MHSIIFALGQMPDRDAETTKQSNWHNATREPENIAKNLLSVEPLGKGVWMLTGGDALPSPARMIKSAEDWKIPYRVLFVEAATEWKVSQPVD